MAKIDPGLKFLLRQDSAALSSLSSEVAFNVEAAVEPRATVLLQFDGDVAEIESAGFAPRSVAGDVATGEVPLHLLEELAGHPAIRRMEASRVLGSELDLTLPEVKAGPVHTGPPGHRGAGVIVGIIDSGIDYTHEAFRRSDGTSRIIAIWDQGLDPQGNESPPAGFTFGVEYQTNAINAALAEADPFSFVRHRDAQIPLDGFHGTHVAGIAAGDGSAPGQGHPAFHFIGVAPEASLIVVANTRGRAGELGLGDSADTLDAVRYIFDVAASLGRPVVINQSQGDNIGPHDGTSLLEVGIDNLLGGQGRAMVKSAGNEGARGRHASGTVGGTASMLQFKVPPNQFTPVTIDLWYADGDSFDVVVTDPLGESTPVVSPGADPVPMTLASGNEVFVDSDLDDPGNGHNRVFLVVSRGTADTVRPSAWTIEIRRTTTGPGTWDAWIQRNASAVFLPPFVNPARTISVPGTGRQMITVGSYVVRGAGVGSISSFSSLGPTRDGRQAPTLAAPGQAVIAPQPASTGDLYGPMQGTSMAAPVVTGAIALMLQKNPLLTQADIRHCLQSSARSDKFTDNTPNHAWGSGKLDVHAAFEGVAVPSGAESTGTAFWFDSPGYSTS
ncbi:S8 family peptidase [Actinoplanes sp. URMC 104]|uniref:S8 family peptidase n=1 Tax=Actinoplanes sp. URMC 104 TaxID=3423409 RepID=UPI003F1CCF00